MRRLLSRLVPQSLKNIYHLVQAVMATVWYGFPARKLRVVGVTGTNGKTTTSQFIAKILLAAGKKTALASTINFQMGERTWVNESKFTTLSPWKLQRFLRDAVREDCEYAVIETSSHALDQNRVWGIPYEIAVMTNVTREHLDYHGTMERYREAKRRLFRRAKYVVVNLDMETPQEFFSPQGTTVTYSTKNPQADLLARDVTLDFKGTDFVVAGVRVHLRVPGLFNIENALTALGVARLLDIDLALAGKSLSDIAGVSGRMELVPNHMNADILIDYAVTPDAFEKLYASILPLKIPGSKIIHVFGACGERDRGKRPQMGEIASSYADIIILTNEDPFHENGEQILDDIEQGVTKKRDKTYFRIYDRREAIHKALSMAEIGDIVLITGKGAEVTMAFGDERIPWSERQVIEEELEKLRSISPEEK
ncbi:MAG: UDP-N-acetylmuramoyl-L-alanyl-D-glutamate--2,6-diaminopimelate ligase [Candidatus Moranbacteria bacterium]|jgi:UDP-N-acetylmuramoyl-L-alanyl-D-glutamate--2,6-diaminopimelate ligase|nr:UDP-N-acetylmuramoyl-L-alanyl-D-glutamate--2,6-diaminopimelate ligase [Candidatus Moranbacteria bacterium]